LTPVEVEDEDDFEEDVIFSQQESVRYNLRGKE
jgi:hypothetical protein